MSIANILSELTVTRTLPPNLLGDVFIPLPQIQLIVTFVDSNFLQRKRVQSVDFDEKPMSYLKSTH